MNASLVLTLVMGLILLVGCATWQDAPRTCLEQRVYVDSFGQGDHPAQFALVLEIELRDEGFVVVKDKGDADLVVSGILTSGPVVGSVVIAPSPLAAMLAAGRGGSYQTVVARAFKADTGTELWRGYYEPKKPTKLGSLAEDVAEDLWKACKKRWPG